MVLTGQWAAWVEVVAVLRHGDAVRRSSMSTRRGARDMSHHYSAGLVLCHLFLACRIYKHEYKIVIPSLYVHNPAYKIYITLHPSNLSSTSRPSTPRCLSSAPTRSQFPRDFLHLSYYSSLLVAR